MRFSIWHRVFLLLVLVIISRAVVLSQPIAKDGVLDLRSYSFDDEGVLKIAGEWEFYWNQLIDPMLDVDESGVMVPVPSSWMDLQSYVPDIERYGYASYRLKIMLSEDVRSLAFSFRKVVGGSGYYVNGKNIGYRGFPATNRHQYEFDYRPSQQLTPVNDSIVSLIVHVSNFDHAFSGLSGAVEIGYPTQIYQVQAKRMKQNYFVLGAFLLIGLYFFMQFFIISDKYKLYFSMICFGMSYWMILLIAPDLRFLDGISGKLSFRLDSLSFAFILPFFILLLKDEFTYDFPTKIFRVALWLSIFIFVIIIISPLNLYSRLMPGILAFVSLSGLYAIVILVISIIRGRKFAFSYTIGILIAVGGAIYDSLILTDHFSGEYISHLTMFIFLLQFTMIYAAKSNIHVKKSVVLSQEITAINENLESIVDNRTKELKEKSDLLLTKQLELEKTNEKLQKVLNVRNRFFMIIGHDIRGPVSANTQMLELLNNGHFTKEEEKEMMKLVLESSRATQSLVDNLLVWGRAQNDELIVQNELFDIYPYAEEVTDLFLLSYKDKLVKIVNEIEEKTFIYCDKQHVRLLLRNLVGNALKFSNKGGLVKISTFFRQESGEIVLTVKDTGIGIPKSILPKLFSEDEFVSTVGTKREKGTGIGLKLCKEIAEANGGSIEVESEAGRGTCIKVNLPALSK